MFFLKTSFINISIKDSLYEISTNEMILIIKSVKIYEINNKKYSSIVSIYYHKILEYWNLEKSSTVFNFVYSFLVNPLKTIVKWPLNQFLKHFKIKIN